MKKLRIPAFIMLLLGLIIAPVAAAQADTTTASWEENSIIDNTHTMSLEDETTMLGMLGTNTDQTGLIYHVLIVPSLNGQKMKDATTGYAGEIPANGVFILMAGDSPTFDMALGARPGNTLRPEDLIELTKHVQSQTEGHVYLAATSTIINNISDLYMGDDPKYYDAPAKLDGASTVITVVIIVFAVMGCILLHTAWMRRRRDARSAKYAVEDEDNWPFS